MEKRDSFIERLNSYFRVDDFDDYTVNGLQVEGKPELRTVITGVSPSRRLFETAIEHHADLIILHHGLFWKKGTPNPFYLRGILKDRVKLLLDNNINLAAYHLPMDSHAETGNNIRILKLLNIEMIEALSIGYMGISNPAIGINQLQARLHGIVPDKPVVFPYGPDEISKVAVISGGGSGELSLASDCGVHAFITGDLLEPAVRDAEELGIHYISIGHYNSERFGPMALADFINEEFNVRAVYIDVPNPA